MAVTLDHPALAPLKAKFPDVKFLVTEFRDQTFVVVPRDRLVDVCTFLRNDPTQHFDMLFELNGVDYLNFPGGKLPGRFAVNYGLLSLTTNARLWLKCFLTPTQDTAPESPACKHRDEDVTRRGDPGLMVPSVTSVWPGAEWMEREAYDLLGIIFTNHPDLRRIMTWNGFGSYPLRKDYPLRGVGEREGYKIVTREGA